MRSILGLLLCVLPLAQPPHPAQNSQPKQLVLTHVTVIDATGAPANSDMTVVITGDRITELGKTQTVRVPKEAQVIDATGKFLIPGLWDMHVHWYLKDYLPLFIANGVTGVRLMWGMPMHQQWRKEIENGTVLGPRLFIASPIVDGPNPVWPASVSVSNDREARQAVTKAREDGADFIKVYSRLTREAFFAIADETKKQGISFAGHVPQSVTVAEASDAGQKSIEHLTGILTACSSREEEFRKQTEAAGSKLPQGQIPNPAALRQLNRLVLETFSPDKAAALFARFNRNQTWQCPTLTVLRSTSSLDDPSFRNDPRLKYMPSATRTQWDPTKDFRFKNRTAEDFELARLMFKKQVEVVGGMRRAGVEFLAGTDVLNPYCFPGFSLHDELVLLVSAGLTPMEALQAATLNPARFLGKETELGTVEKGKIADLVLLDANPLEDIHNTQKINAVMVRGKLIPKAGLQRMLATIETAAANRK
ncbi:MAG TPA: amidohydrolase family protein [Blastocatellia bacterium]|nr:amidohydrolase family protein [Blastocatellia bacterium]